MEQQTRKWHMSVPDKKEELWNSSAQRRTSNPGSQHNYVVRYMVAGILS